MNFKFNLLSRSFLVLITIFSLVLNPYFLAPLVAQERENRFFTQPQKEFAPNQVIVKFKQGSPADDATINELGFRSSRKILEKHHLKDNLKAKIEQIGLDRVVLLEKENIDVLEEVKKLKNDPAVEYAEPNYRVSINLAPNDPYYNLLWGLNNNGQSGGSVDADIDAYEAWDTTKSSNVVVGVIDTGIDYNHEDLKDNIWVNQAEASGSAQVDDDENGFVDDVYGYDFYNNDPDPMDDYGHGTHVAGTIGAVGNNGIGVVGVNWQIKIAAVKFLGSGGYGWTDDAVEALVYANAMGFKITNNSWGGGGYSQALFDALTATNDQGNLFVASAGNSGVDNDTFLSYPASYPHDNIISVAATDHNDNLAYFSNYGETTVDLGAPGVNIYSTVPKFSCSLCDPTGYKYLSGTSMASPHVSGVLALLYSSNPTLSHLELKGRLLSAIDPINALIGKTVSEGRLNANNPGENDTTPPDAVSNLSSTSKTITSITLQWTTTGDDGNVGTASKYNLRYSPTPIDDNNFSQATRVSNVPKPLPSGTVQSYTIAGLSPNTTYYFALKVLDNLNNISGLSNIASDSTLEATVVFSDDMESGINGWVIDGSTGEATPSSGLWHLSQRKSSSPQNAWYYGKEGSGNYNTGFRNWGSITRDVDLTSVTGVQLDYKQYLSVENNTNFDLADVRISTDSGKTWTVLAKKPQTITKSWVSQTVNLSPYDGSQVKLQFYFDTVDTLYNEYEGWYLDDIQIIGIVNKKPQAAIGGPYSGDEDQPVTFDGSASSDPDGNSLTYKWDFGDGSGAITTLGGGSTAPSGNPIVLHTYINGGIYTASLTVNDGKLDSDPSSTTVTITGINDPPIANAAGPYTASEDQPVTLDGSASYDPDKDFLTYKWDFGDGTSSSLSTLGGGGTAPNPALIEHTYTKGGTYDIALIVNDGTQDSSPSATYVEVTEVNDHPNAQAGASHSGIEDLPVIFDGSLSSDEEGSPLTYIWDFGDGNNIATSSATINHTYNRGGVYFASLMVNDGELDSKSAVIFIDLAEVNDPPVANAGADQVATLYSQQAFDGSNSSDEEGDIVTYSWSFGDENTASGKLVNHIYSRVGNYTVTLRVIDSEGVWAEDTSQVTINDPGQFSLNLNTVNSYAAFAAAPHNQELNLTKSWTIESWFKDQHLRGSYNHPFTPILSKGNKNNTPYLLGIEEGFISLNLRINGVIYTYAYNLTQNKVSFNAWHHFAAAYNSQTRNIIIYLDGKAVMSGLLKGNLSGNIAPIFFGRLGYLNYFRGNLDEIRIWNIARSGVEIQASYNKELTGNENGLKGYWRFNEGMDVVAIDRASVPQDANLYNGAIFSTDSPID